MVIEQQAKRDLILSPGSYAYLQDGTKGLIKVYVGPTSITPSAQEVPVVYNSREGKFERVGTYEEAVRRSPVAVEGYYIVLLNPAQGDKHPEAGSASNSPELIIGRKIIVPGPAHFALWPGQAAEVIRGHHLRYNQYLIARVYNEEEAKKNASNAIIKSADNTDANSTSDQTDRDTVSLQADQLKILPEKLTVGSQFIIRGDQVSFYIPPTGISIVKDENDQYIRNALTLERLEYCILIDEDGNKRYEKGPKVVFPKPSEKFKESLNDEGHLVKKFRAVELNENQGIHLKVIASYTDGGKSYKEGEELFITGKDTAIYYPREEHSVIKYEGRVKHFATAIPVGEARYVMDRDTGEIRMVKGPAMLLPDPRKEVLVRRVLSKKQAELWYPGNSEVANYNEKLRSLQRDGSDSHGAITESQFKGPVRERKVAATSYELLHSSVEASALPPSQEQLLKSSRSLGVSNSQVDREQGVQGDQFHRSNTYTPPRMITLDTKFQGAPCIDVWTGFAVQVVSKRGTRRVEKGPTTILLEYDESLEILDLSTGKPKTTDRTIRTAYLRVDNNQVSDAVVVDTADHVAVELRLSFRVDFEGESSKWFQVENYVKLLCDHVRSVLKGRVRKMSIEEFYRNATDHIRSFILGDPGEGGKRPGMVFSDNNMRVRDVEVLRVTLMDDRIRQMLDNAQHEAVRSNIELENTRRTLEFVKEKENLQRERILTESETNKIRNQVEMELAASLLEVELKRIEGELKKLDGKLLMVQQEENIEDERTRHQLERIAAKFEVELDTEESRQRLKLEYLKSESEAIVNRLGVLLPGFSEALLALSRDEVIAKVASALNIQSIIGGKSVADSLNIAFRGTGLENSIKAVLDKVPALPVVSTPNGNGKSPVA